MRSQTISRDHRIIAFGLWNSQQAKTNMMKRVLAKKTHQVGCKKFDYQALD